MNRFVVQLAQSSQTIDHIIRNTLSPLSPQLILSHTFQTDPVPRMSHFPGTHEDEIGSTERIMDHTRPSGLSYSTALESGSGSPPAGREEA